MTTIVGSPNGTLPSTLTIAWTWLVAAHVGSCDKSTFEEFISENALLLDTRLPERHFSAARLSGARARREWVEPDISQLPSQRDSASRLLKTGEEVG
jgi:hypothetical protein